VLRVGRLWFGSNRYQRWSSLLPLSGRSVRDALVTARNYALMRSWHSPPYIGHNPMQQFAYTGFYVLLLAMVVTGFAIYAMYEPRHWFFGWFMWINDGLGNATVRWLHTIGMWLALLFIPGHIYLSVLAGNVEREGTVSSIVSGGRWLRRGTRFVDE